MTTSRRLVPALLAIALAALAALAAPPAPAAAVATAKPEQGPLNPAFVEALHDPLVGIGLGRLPSPVEVHVGAAAQARAARRAAPPSYRPARRRPPHRGQGPGVLEHLLGVRQHRRPRVQAHAHRSGA